MLSVFYPIIYYIRKHLAWNSFVLNFLKIQKIIDFIFQGGAAGIC